MNKHHAGRRRDIALRTCVICQEKSPKRSLKRIVQTAQGIQVDSSGRLQGRGAYLCTRASCWQQALASDRLNRALRSTLTEEDRELLRRARPQC